MARIKSNVINLKPIKKEYHLTEAKIKKLPTRTANLDAWKEETFKSRNHKGLAIRRTPKGKRDGLPKEFTDRWICTGTPKGASRNIRIIGADPQTIKVSQATAWFNKQKALMADGINPNQVNKEARESDEPTIIELAESFIENADLNENSKGTYQSYIRRIEKIVGNKTFSEFKESYFKPLLDGLANDPQKTVMHFLQRIQKRLKPKYRQDETIKEMYYRVIDKKLPESKSRKEWYLAYEPNNQQIAQWFLALQYATKGYHIRKGSRYRGERVEIEKDDLPDDLLPHQLEGMGLDEEYYDAFKLTQATQDTFIKPIINYRSTTDAFFLCFLTGLRKENVFKLKWEHIAWSTNTIIIKKMKGKRKGNDKEDYENVQIRMTPYTHAILKYRESVKQSGDEYIFPNERTRKPFGKSTPSNQGVLLPIWACLLDFTDEFPNIRSLTLDRSEDMNNPKTYQQNPLAPIIDKEYDYYLPINEELPRLVKEIKRNILHVSIKTARELGKLELSAKHLVHKLGFNPHGLRRTASNVARLLGFSTTIILRHSESGKTDHVHYSKESVSEEAKALSKVHQYIDNRIFESLGMESDMGTDPKTNDKVFLSPILSYFGQRKFIPRDFYFDFSKHTKNILGQEKETIDEVYELEEFPSEMKPN